MRRAQSSACSDGCRYICNLTFVCFRWPPKQALSWSLEQWPMLAVIQVAQIYALSALIGTWSPPFDNFQIRLLSPVLLLGRPLDNYAVDYVV